MNPISIFIVEDELLISASLKTQLQSFGYIILGSNTRGEQCIGEIERLSKEGKEPDIILMDIHLRGEIDGIETARRLIEKFNCAIIFLTGQSSKEIYERSFSLKPFGYLLKPIDMEQTKMTIEIAAYQRNLEIENVIYQQQLEDLLEERERENDELMELYQTIISNSLLGMTILQEKKFVFMNDRTPEIFGYTPEEFKQLSMETIFKMILPEDRKRMFHDDTFRKQEIVSPVKNIYRITRKDGSIACLETDVKFITLKGKPAIYKTFLDITSYQGSIPEKTR